MGYCMGIDLGTSGVRVIIVDGKGSVVSTYTVDYEFDQPKMGWAEQEPDVWWNATACAIRQALLKIDPNEIKGIGLTGQMHGSVLLDQNKQPLCNAILWCDQRTSVECQEIEALVGRKQLINIAANPALTGFTAPKLLWIKKHRPDIYQRIAHLLLPKDYIRYKLTGELAADVTDASGTLLLDVGQRKWSSRLVQKLGLSSEWLPRIFESHEIVGKVTQRVSELTGLAEGTAVIAGAGDQAAGAIGNGIVKAGVISCTIGTSGVVFAASDEPQIDSDGRVHTFCHAIPQMWHVMGVTQGAGLSLKWFRDNFGQTEKTLSKFTGTDAYYYLSEEAAQASPGSMGLIYLPYLMGERTPHLDPFARGVFFGLTAKHRRQEMIRSIMEGVAFSLKDSLGIIQEMGLPIEEIRLAGGGAYSSLWRQIIADVFEFPVTITNVQEGPAYGAALLASVGVGIYQDVGEVCDQRIKAIEVLDPLLENKNLYRANYQLYKKLYPTLKDVFSESAVNPIEEM